MIRRQHSLLRCQWTNLRANKDCNHAHHEQKEPQDVAETLNAVVKAVDHASRHDVWPVVLLSLACVFGLSSISCFLCLVLFSLFLLFLTAIEDLTVVADVCKVSVMDDLS